LRNYVDKLFSSTRRTRKRVQDNSRFAVPGEKAPVNAPRWTLTGYNGSLKSCIEKHIVIDEDEDYVGDDEDDDEEDEDYVPPEESNKDENDDMDIDNGEGEKGGNEDEGGDEDEDRNGNRSDRSKSVVSEAYDYLSD
jgi:hypothetical protein